MRFSHVIRVVGFGGEVREVHSFAIAHAEHATRVQSPRATEEVPLKLLRPARGHISTTFAEHAARAPGYAFCGTDFGWSSIADWGVSAAQSGRVIFAGWSGRDYGNLIVIDHGNGWTTWYAHLDSIAVTVSQNVTAGQSIGVMGASGNAQGRHLHFELRINGVQVDAEPYFVSAADWAAWEAELESPEEDTVNASVVNNYTRSNKGEATHALIYPDGTARRLTGKDDVVALITAHVRVYGLKRTDGGANRNLWEQYGGQLNDNEWRRFWASYPSKMVGFLPAKEGY